MSDLVQDFARQIQIVPSSRSHVLMLIGFFGGSGGGKTVTALVASIGLSRGGKVGIIDTEQKRSGIAADVAKKLVTSKYPGVEVVAVYLDPPFHPLKYVAAIHRLQEDGCKAIVVDSMSHAWNGDGGYLDIKEAALTHMAGDDWNKREKCSMAAAARTKPQTHAKLVDALLHCAVPTVLCFRSKEKTRMGKADGKTVIRKDDDATPIQEEGLIYEMLISGEVKANDGGAGGFCRFRGPGCKHTHPEILKLLPEESEQFSIAHAEALAAWCAAPGFESKPTSNGNGNGKSELLGKLRTMTESIHGWKKGMSAGEWQSLKPKLDQWLWDELVMADTEALSDLDIPRLNEVIENTKNKLSQKS